MSQHLCHAVGCTAEVPPKLLFCRRHWFMVPRHLRDEVWACYRPGQEVTKDPSVDYLIAAKRAIGAVAVREGRLTQEQVDECVTRLEALQ